MSLSMSKITTFMRKSTQFQEIQANPFQQKLRDFFSEKTVFFLFLGLRRKRTEISSKIGATGNLEKSCQELSRYLQTKTKLYPLRNIRQSFVPYIKSSVGFFHKFCFSLQTKSCQLRKNGRETSLRKISLSNQNSLFPRTSGR